MSDYLAAIVARDAACAPDLSDVYEENRPDDWRTSAADRRALLALLRETHQLLRREAALAHAWGDSHHSASDWTECNAPSCAAVNSLDLRLEPVR